MPEILKIGTKVYFLDWPHFTNDYLYGYICEERIKYMSDDHLGSYYVKIKGKRSLIDCSRVMIYPNDHLGELLYF